MTLMMMHVNDPVPDMSAEGITAPLDRVLERALAKDPEDRYPNAHDMAAALRSAKPDTGAPQQAAPDPTTDEEVSDAAPGAVVSATIDSEPGRPGPKTPEPGISPESSSPASKTPPRRLAAILGALALVVVVIVVVVTSGPTDPDGLEATAPIDGELEQTAALQTADLAETTTTVTAAVVAAPVATSPPTTVTTIAPTTTTEPPPPEVVEITAISIESGRYIVEYVTTGYTEALPGDHVHFYWNSIYESEAGVGPNQIDWFVWGGPRPFNGYAVADHPEVSTAMCAVVANPDHTIKPGTGNCFDLP